MGFSDDFVRRVNAHPDRFYIIHYSSQSLFDAESGALSPRITSIVVQHYQTRQTKSFAMHLEAEELCIAAADVESSYDKIERQLLERFYEFARDRRDKSWVHWNMRNATYGFEHIEHRYRILTKLEPPNIPVEVRINLNDVLKSRYGNDYVPDPRMANLMERNGGKVQGFLSGQEESEAFKARDFIRMNTSTISKVSFFAHVIDLMKRGKLRTDGNGILNFVDKALETRSARLIASGSAVIGLTTGAVQIYLWLQ